MKFCYKCKQHKPTDSFSKNSNNPCGLQTYCKTCTSAYNKQWSSNNKEKLRAIRVKTRYGITLEDLDDMIETQGGCCVICGDEITRSSCVDHCHTSGEVRGILCPACNKGLGCFRDNIDSLATAIQYLNNNRGA